MAWIPYMATARELGIAARASQSGQQASDCAFRFTQLLGSAPVVHLYRNSTLVSTITLAGVTSSGPTISASTIASQDIDDADIDTGTWTADIESDDAGHGASTTDVAKSGTHDVLVLADLVAADGVTITVSIDMDANLSNTGGGGGASGELPDYEVATWYVTAALPYASHTAGSKLDTDWEGKTSASSDGRKRFASDISEPGTSYGGYYQIERLADPIQGGTKRAIRLRTGASFGLSWDSSGARRNELSDRLSGATNYAIPGREYMACFANTRPSSDSWSASQDWANFFGIFQVHPYDGQSPPIMLSYGNGGRAPVLIRRSTSNTSGEPWQPLGGAVPSNTWIGWLVHFRLSHLAGGNPFIRIYRADGLVSWVKVYDETGVPNTYNSTSASPHHFKSGMYGSTSNLGTVGGAGVTMLHKGVLAIDLTTNAGACDEASMLEHLRSV